MASTNYSSQPLPPYQPQSSSNLAPNDERYLYDPNNPTHSRPASPLPPSTPRRGSQQSSAGESNYEYDKELESLMTTTNATRTLDVLHTKSHLNMRILDSTTSQVLYYVDNSAFTPGRPDVTLIRGSEKTDPVAGVVRWSSMYSKTLRIGIGDPGIADGEKSMIWEEVHNEHRRHPEYKWAVTGQDGMRHEFMWVRTHGSEAKHLGGEETNSSSFRNFKLIDCASQAQTGNGEVLAVFACNAFKSWKKLGKVVFRVDGSMRGWGQEWEVMVLLSVLGLVEMSRRRARQRRSSGAHGGP
ncbi:hypothetical protein LTR64_004058 [Lithohypha guttulata]|uniref:uncharacterized protein n=1 Tax=Lithohypha guttulata TaxID=1690604 RepID=UPI002DDDBF7D|nr:hypothetical protein LTR51_006648 [Lithohypha guttulata]